MLSWWFSLAGESFLAVRLHVTLQAMVLTALTFLASRRLLGLGLIESSLLTLFEILWSPHFMHGIIWYNNDAAFFAMAAGLSLMWAWREEKPLWNLAAGALCALSFWSKQDIGAGAMAGGLASTLLLWRTAGSPRKAAHVLAFVSGLILVCGAICFHYWRHGALDDMVFWITKRGLMMKWEGPLTWTRSLEKAFSPFTTSVDRASKFFVLLMALPIPCSLSRYLVSRDRIELLGLGAAILWLSAYYAGLFTHDGQGFTVDLAAFACALGLVRRPWPAPSPEPSRARLDAWNLRLVGLVPPRLAAVSFLALLAVLGARGLRYAKNMGWPPSEHTHVLRTPRLAGLHIRPEAAAIDLLSGFIEERVPADEGFLILDLSIVYFTTGRRPVSPLTYFNIGDMQLDDEDRILASAADPSLRWFFYPGGRERFDADPFEGMGRLKTYLGAHFQFDGEAGGYSVLRRISA